MLPETQTLDLGHMRGTWSEALASEMEVEGPTEQLEGNGAELPSVNSLNPRWGESRFSIAVLATFISTLA